MRTIEWLVIAALLVPGGAFAQGPNPYSGTWNVKMLSRKGETRTGTVILKDQDGTWDIAWHKSKNPCAGRRSPIVIQRTSAHFSG